MREDDRACENLVESEVGRGPEKDPEMYGDSQHQGVLLHGDN